MDTQLHILYIANEASPTDTVRSTLGDDWQVSVADSPTDATGRISDADVDCIVFDADPETPEGVDFYIEHDEVIGDTPFVLYTATDSITHLQRAIRSGIDDVVVKDTAIEADGGVATGDAGAVESSTPNPALTAGETPSTVTDSITLLRYRLATLLLDQDIEIEEVVFSSIRSLLGAADDELDLKIDFALESLGEAIGATRCIVYNFNDEAGDAGIYEQVNEWCGKESGCHDPDVSVIGRDDIAASEYPGHETHATQFEYVCRDWTPASTLPIHTNTVEQGETRVGTFVSYPLVVDWQLQGVIAVTTKYPRTWTERVNRQIKSLGEVILTTKQQRDNRTQLKKQNEQLEQFTSVISHDLQNPLSIAKGYVNISREGNEDETPHLNEAAEALKRMEDMLDELLTLAKQGEAIGETTPTDVATVVNNAWGNVETKQAELVIDGLNSMPKQQADPSRLQEAIENLIKNAIDHVGDDVEITVRRIEETGFAVGDDGGGIPDDELGQIFDRGYTGGDGTGFGLAIVEEVVDAHGWEIEVGESDAGGAEFRIYTDDS
jgi:signal transduction histidine kinase